MLSTTLSATVTDDCVDLSLVVENDGSKPVSLSFRDGQRVDFAAFDGTEEDQAPEIWRWSKGRMFTQALGTETVPPGETVAFDAEWSSPPSGEYNVVGAVTAHEVESARTDLSTDDLRDETTVTIP